MPAEHQRVFLIEEKVRQTPGRSPEGFYRGKETLSDQSAGGARKRHVFCAVCPCRPAGPALGRVLLFFPGSNSRKYYQSKEGLAVLPRSIYTIPDGFQTRFS